MKVYKWDEGTVYQKGSYKRESPRIGTVKVANRYIRPLGQMHDIWTFIIVRTKVE